MKRSKYPSSKCSESFRMKIIKSLRKSKGFLKIFYRFGNLENEWGAFPLEIQWPVVITKEDLWKHTNQNKMQQQIRKKKWRWIGHTLRRSPNRKTRQALFWSTQGKRWRGRPKTNWRKSCEQELGTRSMTWEDAWTTESGESLLMTYASEGPRR